MAKIMLRMFGRQTEADILLNLGKQQYDTSRFRAALQSWQYALTIYQRIGNRQGEAKSLGNLGSVYHLLGQYQVAINHYEQSLQIAQEIGDSQGVANSLGNLGNAFDSLGQYPKAIEFHQRSLAIKRATGNCEKGEAISLGNLGNAYSCLELYEKALEYHQQSLDISKKISDDKGVVNTLNNVGNIYSCLRLYEKAVECYEQSFAKAKKIYDRQGEADSISGLGNVYYSLKQYPEAIIFHHQHLAIAYEIGDYQGKAIALNNLGNTLLKTNQLTEAEEFLYSAIEILEALRSQLSNYNHKISIFETHLRTYCLLQEVLVSKAKFDTALEIAERGRTRAFVELFSKTFFTTDNANNSLANITLSTVQIKQIAQSQKATIIEYSILIEDIYIWVILPNGEIAFRRANLQPLEQLNQTLANLESIILKSRVSIGIEEKDATGQKIKLEPEFKLEQGRYPLLQLLYEILISPIADLLPQHPNAKVIFIPHYNLFLVPFPALQNPADGSYLIENHTILTAPSIQILDLTHQHHQNIRGLNQSSLVVGDPIIAPKFSEDPYKLQPIPAAKEAAEQIAALLETEAITGEKATKAVIMDRILGVRIAHISAHGLLDDFGDSGIPGAIILAPASATDDGAIRAIDILALKLNSEIVVLSACSTGKGKITGDGIIGLSRCFILAGVPSVIVSLWNMGALSAKLLMTEFYQNLERGMDRAAALRYAMLRTKARFSRPADWAAFTLIGETESLSIETQNVEQKELTMPFSPESTPKEIIDAFVNLYDTSDLFDYHREALAELNVAPTESVKEIAKKIEAWCEDKPQIKENMDNELCQMGAGGTESKPDEEVVREFNDRLIDNRTRLGSPPPSSGTKDKN